MVAAAAAVVAVVAAAAAAAAAAARSTVPKDDDEKEDAAAILAALSLSLRVAVDFAEAGTTPAAAHAATFSRRATLPPPLDSIPPACLARCKTTARHARPAARRNPTGSSRLGS